MMILDVIVEDKKKRLKEHKARTSEEEMKELALASERKSISFYEALAKPGLSIIGEFKKASPSMGKIEMTMELMDRIDEYNISVDAISCLTEEDHFLGNTDYFKEIRNISPLPMIRKDFIIDPYQIYEADADAEYEQEITIDLSTLKSTVAFPHLPENTKTIDEVGDITIDQVVIGSCTNGRIDDLRCAAEILKGKKVAKGLRVIIIPATQKIYLQAMEEGLLKTFIEAGAVVSTPTCGPCLGGYMGILAAGEKCVSTTNRNFVGRMGHVDSEIYLASPAVAAASAVTGKISGPDTL